MFSNGFFCNDGMCSRVSHGSNGLTIDMRPDSSSSSSYSAPVAYSVKGGKEGGSDGYVGHGGAICTTSDIQKATSVVNALGDTTGVGNQIFALLAVLFDNIKFECSAENISGKCEQIKSQVKMLYEKDGINKIKLQKMHGILKNKEINKELKSEEEKYLLKYLEEYYHTPVNPDPKRYVFSFKDNTGIYFDQLPPYRSWMFGFEKPPEGYIINSMFGIKLDWSNEWKKMNELLAPKTQTVYCVDNLTFFNRESVDDYLRRSYQQPAPKGFGRHGSTYP